MIGIDVEKLKAACELLRLLNTMSRAMQPSCTCPPYFPPPPQPPPQPPPFPPPFPPPQPMMVPVLPDDATSISLLKAAEVIERGSERALEAIRNGTDSARVALMQLAVQRDEEHVVIEQMIDSLNKFKALEREHRGEPKHHGGKQVGS